MVGWKGIFHPITEIRVNRGETFEVVKRGSSGECASSIRGCLRMVLRIHEKNSISMPFLNRQTTSKPTTSAPSDQHLSSGRLLVTFGLPPACAATCLLLLTPYHSSQGLLIIRGRCCQPIWGNFLRKPGVARLRFSHFNCWWIAKFILANPTHHRSGTKACCGMYEKIDAGWIRQCQRQSGDDRKRLEIRQNISLV